MTWTAGEPDAVVLGRLRNASVVQGLAEERVRVVLQVRIRLEIKPCPLQHLVGQHVCHRRCWRKGFFWVRGGRDRYLSTLVGHMHCKHACMGLRVMHI